MKKVKNWFKYEVWSRITSTMLCIRFPFLYPRNRWTGLHYNDWKLIDKRKKIYSFHHLDTTDNACDVKKGYYFKKVTESGWAEYWDNWWSKPLVKVMDFYHDYVLQFLHCIPNHTELGNLKSEGYGWYKVFGIKLCKELRWQLIKEGNLFSFRITQWKEKWGCMELYTGPASQEVYDIINKYSTMSADICVFCGEPAVYRTTPYSWELPYCKKCYDNSRSKPLIEWIKDENGKWVDNPDFPKEM